MIETIDFHTHICAESNIELEQSVSERDVSSILDDYIHRLRSYELDHAVAIIMDEEFLLDSDAISSMRNVMMESSMFSPVFLLDPLSDDFDHLLDQVVDIDGVGVKFHPYIQKIEYDEHSSRLGRVFEAIDDRGLLTIIDCNYAGNHMFEYNGIPLGHEMAKTVDSPVILAHAGNVNILDAFAVARNSDNVWLDVSLTLPYWMGSSVGQDIAFSMKKMDMERWVWGSDMPLNDPTDCREGVRRFLNKHDLSAYESDLFSDNARELLGW